MSGTEIFPSGLKKLNPGVAPGDPYADSSKAVLDKLNYNLARLLTTEGSFLGPGLRWTNGLITLANTAGNILIGSSQYGLSNEFKTANGLFQLDAIPVGKIVGALSPARIGLTNGEILVGGTNNTGRALAINLDHFTLVDDRLAIRAIPSSALANIQIAPERLALENKQIVIGRLNNSPAAYELGPEFTIINNKVRVVIPTTIDAASILTIPNFLGTTPLTLTKSLDNLGAEKLSWVDSVSATQLALEKRLTNRNSKNTIYVNALTGNDNLDNPGTSAYSPFKTVARAYIQVVRNSYKAGLGTVGADDFDAAVIHLMPGVNFIDNRPGLTLDNFATTQTAVEDLIAANELWKFNPIRGGVIAPRGCSTLGTDLRKSTLVPVYVPVPGDTRTSILRLTGGSYISQVNFKDNPLVLRSHHLLDCMQYASLAELNLYYLKIYNAFKTIDGYSSLGGPNLEPVLAETQIVGDASSTGAIDANGYPAVNSVKSASPYIFNCSVRSRFGLCGVLIDGNEVTGFKSMVAAQFTNVSLQVDPTVFTIDLTDPLENKNYIVGARHYAIKAVNDAYAQLVSCFAIGHAIHFWTDSGGEFSVSNSCSNFGAISLYSTGHSNAALAQDSGYGAIRLLPPVIIEPISQEFVVTSLDPVRVTPLRIGATSIINVDPVKFLNSTYIYVRIPHPITPGLQLDLQAKLVSSGATTNSVSPAVFNVLNGTTVDTENSIYKYLNCLGAYEFQSVWYDPLFPPVGGIPAALATEKSLRTQLLQQANIFVKRIVERRTEEERNYHLIISAPINTRLPQINYVLNRPEFITRNHKYFVSAVKEISAADLAGDAECCTISGQVYQLTILRANRPDLPLLPEGTPDLPEDIQIAPDYAELIANLDPRLFTTAQLTEVSYNSTGATRQAIVRLLTDLECTESQITTVTTPTVRDTLTHRYRTLPPVAGKIVNSLFTFDVLRPSLIRASNHSWEYVGYRNYNTALPKFQQKALTEAIKLASIQTALNGGRIYATGMDELGNLYQGRNVINLATGVESQIRFDGLQQTSNSTQTTIRSFTDLNITGNLQVNAAKINNLTVGANIFQPISRFKVDAGSGLADLTDANCPLGVKATEYIPGQLPKYGLVRRATPTEVINLTGNGFIAPPDLEAFSEAIQDLSAITLALDSTTVKLSGNQTIAGTTNFSSPVVIPDGIAANNGVNLGQLISSLTTANPLGNTLTFANGIKIQWGLRDTSLIAWSAGNRVTASISFHSSFTNPPIVLLTPKNGGNITVNIIEIFAGAVDFAGDAVRSDYVTGGGIYWLAIGY